MKIGNKEFDLKKVNVMGILNVTPDSFSDGGRYNKIDLALKRVEEMIKDGVDIVDIGAESTRPGHTFVPADMELERLIPILKAIKKEFDIPISIDTYKAEVARESIKYGADLINDIWGLKYDKEMAKVIAEYNIPYCLMHNRKEANYNNFLEDVLLDIQDSLEIAKANNISMDKIIIDPGIGFAKNYDNNIELLKNIDKLHKFKLPILLGTSRKSFIGKILDTTADERVEGTIATSCLAVYNKLSFVRVHDVKENKRAIKVLEEIIGSD